MGYGLNEGFTWNPLRKYPRNLTCFCGSGAKFKKCHEGKIPNAVTPVQAARLQKLLDAVESGTVTPEMISKIRAQEAEEAAHQRRVPKPEEEVAVCAKCRGAGMVAVAAPAGAIEHHGCTVCFSTGLSAKELAGFTPEQIEELRQAQADEMEKMKG